MKKQANFTPYDIETWAAVLSNWDTKLVCTEVVRIGLGEDPFPDIGKLVTLCEKARRKAAGTCAQDGKIVLSDALIQKTAKNLGIEI